MSDESKKYELVDASDSSSVKKLYRIKALRDFHNVKKGDLGGYVESEHNLSHSGTCWIYEEAHVVGNAKVYEDARIRDKAWIYDDAEVYGTATVRNQACVFGHGKVYDNADVSDHANVYQGAKVFKEARVFGRAKLRFNMKATKNITVIDNNDSVITIADSKMHVYRSKIYDKNDYPKKYRKLLESLDKSNE